MERHLAPTSIPLFRRDGSVRAYTIVDESDYDELVAFHWNLGSGYVMRTIWEPNGRRWTERLHRAQHMPFSPEAMVA